MTPLGSDSPAPQPIDPLPNILPARAFHLLSGASGIGKTAFIAAFLKAFHTGATLGGRPCPITPVAYIGGDRAWHTAGYWFDQVGFADVAHYCLVDDHNFSPQLLKGDGPSAFAECVSRLNLPGPSLIVVDPLALFLGGKLLDYTHTAIACIGLSRRLLLNGHTVLGVCHTSKQKTDTKDRYLRPQDRILGSAALLGYSGTQLNLMAPEESGRDDGYYELLINPHTAASETWLLEKSPTTGLFDLEGLKVKRTATGEVDHASDPNDHLSARAEAILEMMEPNRMYTVIEVLDLHPAPKPTLRTVYRALTDLREAGKVDCPAYGLWRRLPPPVTH